MFASSPSLKDLERVDDLGEAGMYTFDDQNPSPKAFTWFYYYIIHGWGDDSARESLD